MSRLVRSPSLGVHRLHPGRHRQHRIVGIFAGRGQQPPFWMYLFALIPLFLLLFSGLYLFVLPYVAQRR